MNRFIAHHPCPRCGSKDNLGEYSDNYYCFGCGYYKAKRSNSRVKAAFSQQIAGDVNQLSVTKTLPRECISWLMKYSLTPQEWENFTWCEDKKLLVLYQDANYWQGRSFAADGKAKYLSEGKKPFIVYGQSLDNFVFVEDIISALKVGRVASASPMLGTMPLKANLRGLQAYKNVFIWNDKDMAIKSLKTAANLSEILGKRVKVIITEKDPKCYNDFNNYII